MSVPQFRNDELASALVPVTFQTIQDKKQTGRPITALTAYDYATARLVDEAGIDLILVGDSLAMVVMGYDNTLSVTVDEMLHHTRAVRRAARRAIVAADMPWGSYHLGVDNAVANAVRFVKEGGAQAVKIEGGASRAELVERLTSAEIPVIGHLGLTPQSVNRMGGYKVQGKSAASINELLHLSLIHILFGVVVSRVEHCHPDAALGDVYKRQLLSGSSATEAAPWTPQSWAASSAQDAAPACGCLLYTSRCV